MTNTFQPANLMQVDKLVFHPDTNVLLVADALKGEITQIDGESGAPLGAFGETAEYLFAPIDLAFQLPEPGEGAGAGAALLVLAALGAPRSRPATRRHNTSPSMQARAGREGLPSGAGADGGA